MRISTILQRAAALLLLAGMALQARAYPVDDHRKRDMRAEVQATDVAWRQAELANDAGAVDRLLSDDYLGITMTGQVVTKAQQLDRIRSRQMQISRLAVSDVKIKLIGHTAIVTSLAEVQGVVNGRTLNGLFRSTRVYHRIASGTWKLTSFEATPIRNHGEDGQRQPVPDGQ